jgi:hypothetical protein
METQRVLKTADKKTYMREYKQKQYAENPEHIRNKNKAYYYKNKCKLDSDTMKKYDTLLPYVAKIRTSINEFKDADMNLAIDFLTELLAELQSEKESNI